MTPLKAVTLWQPWASLIAVGEKRIETRSWSTSYRGPLAIHAAARKPEPGLIGRFGVGWHRLIYADHVDEGYTLARTDGQADERGVTVNQTWPMPLGCVVATCTLVDVVPVPEDAPNEDGRRVLWSSFGDSGWTFAGIGDCFLDRGQVPYGDFSPGRYAWLMSDVRALDEPVPCRGRQGLWTLPEEVDRRCLTATS